MDNVSNKSKNERLVNTFTKSIWWIGAPIIIPLWLLLGAIIVIDVHMKRTAGVYEVDICLVAQACDVGYETAEKHAGELWCCCSTVKNSRVVRSPMAAPEGLLGPPQTVYKPRPP